MSSYIPSVGEAETNGSLRLTCQTANHNWGALGSSSRPCFKTRGGQLLKNKTQGSPRAPIHSCIRVHAHNHITHTCGNNYNTPPFKNTTTSCGWHPVRVCNDRRLRDSVNNKVRFPTVLGSVSYQKGHWFKQFTSKTTQNSETKSPTQVLVLGFIKNVQCLRQDVRCFLDSKIIQMQSLLFIMNMLKTKHTGQQRIIHCFPLGKETAQNHDSFTMPFLTFGQETLNEKRSRCSWFHPQAQPS